jgi:oligogalacturonide lyase
VSTLAEQPEIVDPIPCPARAARVAWRGQGGLWLDGKRLATPEGRVLQAHWSPAGDALFYLHAPAAPNELNAIRELTIEGGADTLVSRTSQFVCFAPNADASVFVGASRSLASPTVLLLLRSMRRELTLCEHKSSDPARCGVQFTPDSQRVLFESDRHGKPAIYMLNVERLIEKTGE